jgi:Arc-like DNA binding domain
MPKRTGKKEEARSFSFRMPQEVFDELAAVARSRGVDVSSMLNWILAEYRPILQKKKAEHEKAMLEAAASRQWEAMEPMDALRTLRELLGKLQDEYTELSKQVLEKDERKAG